MATRPADAHLRALAEAVVATRGGTRGLPRSFVVAADGGAVCFLRDVSADDPRQGLWFAGADGDTRLVVHPDDLGDETAVDDVERARRERTRESASGITAFAATPDLDVVTFTYGGVLHVVRPADGTLRRLDVPGPVADPRPSPTGAHVAWVCDGALHVAAIDGAGARVLAADDRPDVTWGLAEFIAAEEMGRLRGYWWSPDGTRLAACRVDVSAVRRWWLHEPSVPGNPPRLLRYPAAGTANADVRLAVFDLDGGRRDVEWDRATLPYLAAVTWTRGTPLTLAVQRRDQRRVEVLVADDDGCRPVRVIEAEPWVELIPGTPCWTGDGRLVTVEDDPSADTRRVAVDGRWMSPAGLHVEAVLATRDRDVVVRATADDATATAVWSVPADGEPGAQPLTPVTGVHDAVVRGATMVVHGQRADDTAVDITVRRGDRVSAVEPVPIALPLEPRPRLARLGPADLHAALLLPSWYREGPLPVLLDPYGGPHGRRVRQAARMYLTGQWFAEAGFAVLVIDGRGTPGRGLAWEHAVAGDLASPALDDQVAGLHAAAEHWRMLDLERVAIRGWSFGGYLAALAVLRRPDVFHAAVAGAPVTEWRLYDTHYSERFLGHPDAAPDAYRASSLLPDAHRLERPLLLLHGMADDNVVMAHTLRLSEELLRAGRPHTVLPLPHTTHVTRDLRQQTGLLAVQLEFVRAALGLTPADGSGLQ